MADLKSILTDASRRQVVVHDAEQLLDEEVNAKGAFAVLPIKGALKIVKSVKPGIVPDAIDGLLDDFAARLDPFYQGWLTAGAGKALPEYFASRKGEIADALLGITDERARVTRHNLLKKAYEGLRPQGKKHVEEAAAGIGRLVAKHAK